MASLVADNPFDTTQQKQFAGTGDVTGYITGGAKNGDTWDFMDQQGKVLTSVPYQDFVNSYQSSGSGAVRDGVTSVNGVPVYNFGSAPAQSSSAPAPTSAAQPSISTSAAQPTSTPASQAQSSAGLIASALPQSGTGMTYTPETRQVDQATGTVQGQVNSILSKDSPLMQRARTLAMQGMAQRGLVNSSMAQGAGTAAMIDRAMPIAQQDASTYNATAAENMAARNRAFEVNSGQLNQFAQQQNQQQFVAGQAALDRAQQTALQTSQQDFTAKQQSIQNDFAKQMQVLQEQGLNARQANDIASREALVKLEQLGITNRFDQELALKSNMFNAEQNNLERRLILENQARLQELGMKIDADRLNIPTSFAANIANTAMSGVNSILADGNLSADAKRAAINNVVTYANTQIAWAEKFYQTAIPRITAPA